jgi:hypothetical protein
MCGERMQLREQQITERVPGASTNPHRSASGMGLS